jgi:hypothetical protein
MAMIRRAAARGNVHVNEAITTGSVIAAQQNGIGVSHDAKVAKAFVFVIIRNP